jgi:3-oxoacyl-[acyl-carrier protein] reductase
MSGRLADRIVVITGGAGAIGRTITERFVAEGARVVVSDLDDGRWEEARATLAVADPERVSFVRADARSDDDVRALVAGVEAELGRIDVLIPTVGGSSDALVHKMTDAQWSDVMDLNLRTAFLACRAAIPGMIERRSGRIVLLSSRSAQGNVGQANYAAAKAGIIGLASSLARELARHRINVNCVVPGFVDNPRLASMPEKYRQMRIDLNPFQEVASPVDVANAILFLASDDAGQITGQALKVAAW